MEFAVDDAKDEEEAGEEKGAKAKKGNYKVSSVLEAADITREQYEELTAAKKRGETSTEDNFKVERHFWQRFFATDELDEDVLKEHMFNPQLLSNFLSLVDIKNHEK